ncbi:chemotaxis protein CheY [Skermanella stibiiresistens SB22]|uniref:histidine kinase n=2 Tax=Skermanella TaxID=204447 RepID=W9GU33_9PROT|nr:chemotaxis protein CheY [Skermanella stibiiresistens SB22]
MRAHDWSTSPLGDPDTWPQALRTVVGLMLTSKFPMFVAWGPELGFLYNDPYAEILGAKHPQALGMPFHDIWAEIWPDISPLIDAAMAGEGTYRENLPLLMNRRGIDERTWFTFSYSPIRDEAGRVAGMFCACTETTQTVVAQHELRESERRFRNMADHAPVMMWVTDPKGYCTYLNSSWYKFTGQTTGEAEGFGWLDATHPDDKAEAERVFLEANAAGRPFRAEYRLRRADGAYRWAIDAAAPRFGSSGEFLGYVGSVVDIDDRRKAEEALKHQEERLRLAIDVGEIGEWDVDALTNTMFWPPRVKAMFGISPDVPVTLDDFHNGVHPDDREETRAAYESASDAHLRAPYDVEYRTIGKEDGVIRWVASKGRGLFDGEGRCTRIIGTAIDITSRKRTEQALHELNGTLERRVAEALAERKLLADLVEGTDAFVQVADVDFRWLAINKAAADEFERIFGVRPAVGRSMLDILQDRPEQRDAVRSVWARALAGEEFTEVGEFGDPERDRRFYEMKYNLLRDTEGRRIGAYQFTYDVTQRMEEQRRLADAEAALRQAQKMEAVGQLTGGIAHDFNNLLTGITGSLEMMQVRMAQGRAGDVDRYVTAAQGAAARAAALTHRLLAFSRRQTLAPKPTDARTLVAGMEELIQRSVGPAIEVETVNAAGLWSSLIDQSQLENAILNLCLNARDAMPDGGKIMIETGNRSLDRRGASERGLEPGQYISLCVSDTGTGMSPEIVAKVFEPFFTTKPIGMGTGLGLSMIYGFAKQSGGTVSIHSEVGRGSMVCIYLPRHAGPAESETTEADLAEAPRAEAGETVLVVDDEPTVRMLVAEVLSDLGYTPIEAGDGAAGLKIINSDMRIDLLVTDVGLPGGMNGRQVADAARQARPDLKVLFITGYAENAVLSHGHLDPGMHVMTKPFAMEALASRVKELINQ